MKYLIISFKSRNELYKFASALKSNGIFLTIISSPKSIGSSCMLSIKTDYKNLNIINQMLLRFKPKSFIGLFSIQPTLNGEQTLRLM